MFLDMDGQIYDYFGGCEDLKAKRVRFAGNPVDRIQEDYLRILRYFRFHARYGCPSIHEKEILVAMRENIAGLGGVSGERLWMEIKRILLIRNCENAITTMFFDLKMPQFLGLKEQSFEEPESKKKVEFLKVHANLFGEQSEHLFSPITLFMSLVEDIEEFSKVVTRLKLSKLEMDIGLFILNNRRDAPEKTTLKKMKRILALSAKPTQQLLNECIKEFLMYTGRLDDLSELSTWQLPDFPVNGRSLIQKVEKPRYIGDAINELKEIWADSDFQMSEEELLFRADEILDRVLNHPHTK